MFPIKNMNNFLKQYSLSEKLFDMYRVVNPLTHQTFDLSFDNKLIATNISCHDIWERGHACKNCISMHTCNEGKQYFKLEFINDVVYLIFSIPIVIDSEKYSLELVKDVTKSMFIANEHSRYKKEVSKIIDKFNEIAVHDLFTGLYNKKYTLDQLQQFSAQKNLNRTLIGMLIDIDGLMSINSKYGHHMGDVVLKRVASVLFSQIDNSDNFVARYDGDKFHLFFKNTKLIDVNKKKEQIKKIISSINFQKENESFNISLSIAIEEMQNKETAEDYMKRLLKNLKEQKKIKELPV